MTGLIIALMIGSGDVTAKCRVEGSAIEFERRRLKDERYSYSKEGYKITENITKDESWVKIEKDGKVMLYSVKCDFF